VAGDAAILVDPLDTGAIAAAVQQIYEKPAYRQDLVCRGLERAKQFTWEGTAEQVARVYEAVVFGTVQK
jgi:glycosyltransferase involved in cell wall biosynthesis